MHMHHLLLFFFFFTPALSRRLLHHPFFPLSFSSPPAQSPSFTFPKYPSSSSTHQKPFFPSNPSPPPPPSASSSLPTFPANISSLITPSSHPPTTKLLQAVALPLISLALLSLLLLLFFLFFRRRTHKHNTNHSSDTDRLFPPNSASSHCPKPLSSEFLYLGTLVNSRGPDEGCSAPPPPPPPPAAAARSPELRPLPPLARKVRRGEKDRSFSSPDEFYSPSGTDSNLVSSASSSPPVLRPPDGPDLNEVLARKAFVAPPPPPPPAPKRAAGESNGVVFCGDGGDKVKAKLKPLHWDKVKASSDRAMVWDQMKSSSFQLNEEMIETLFVCDRKTVVVDGGRKMIPSTAMQQNLVLDPKKSQNIAILLRALNVTKEEVCEALLDGNNDALGNELLETLLRMAPSKEEELKLREYNENSPFKLGPAENFLKAVLDIPFAFKRVEAMLYIANFDSEVNYLKKSFETLETACEELRSSRLFLKLLEAVLKTGNRMNVGTNRGDAQAFKLDTLLKLVDVKGTDGKTTLLHFVVQEIIRAEGSRHSTAKLPSNTIGDDLEYRRLGLQIVSGLGNELGNVKNSAGMDCDMLTSSVLKLAGGIGKVREVLRLNEVLRPAENHQRFHDSMISLLKRAEVEIVKLQVQESVAISLVREITEYFHGNSAMEEAHPFRIFMIVRDFLNILDQVCKEIGRINERTSISLARKPSTPVSQMSAPGFPKFRAARSGSSDDESSS